MEFSLSEQQTPVIPAQAGIQPQLQSHIESRSTDFIADVAKLLLRMKANVNEAARYPPKLRNKLASQQFV